MRFYFRIFVIFLALLLINPAMPAWARKKKSSKQSVTSLKAYIPSPFLYATTVHADKITYAAISETDFDTFCSSSDPDSVNTMAFNTDKGLLFCNSAGTVVGAPGIWTQGDATTVHLTESTADVGIGTSTPAAKLHVAGTGDILAVGSLGTGSIPTSSTGTFFMWYPGKAAFRAGTVSGSGWSDTNTGTYSAVVGGKDGVGYGAYSGVLGGLTNTAAGDYASIIGGSTNSILSSNSSILNGTSVTIGAAAANSTAVGVPPSGSAAISSPYSTILYGKNTGVNNTYASVTFNVDGWIASGGTTASTKGFAPIDAQRTAVLRGLVASGGTFSQASTAGMTVTRTSAGRYTLGYGSMSFGGFYDTPHISVTTVSSTLVTCQVTALSTSQATLKCWNSSGTLTDTDWSFMLTGAVNTASDGALSVTAGGGFTWVPSSGQ